MFNFWCCWLCSYLQCALLGGYKGIYVFLSNSYIIICVGSINLWFCLLYVENLCGGVH